LDELNFSSKEETNAKLVEKKIIFLTGMVLMLIPEIGTGRRWRKSRFDCNCSRYPPITGVGGLVATCIMRVMPIYGL